MWYLMPLPWISIYALIISYVLSSFLSCYVIFSLSPATYGVGSGSGLATDSVMNFAKSCGAFTHSNAEVRDSAKVFSFCSEVLFLLFLTMVQLRESYINFFISIRFKAANTICMTSITPPLTNISIITLSSSPSPSYALCFNVFHLIYCLAVFPLMDLSSYPSG